MGTYIGGFFIACVFGCIIQSICSPVKSLRNIVSVILGFYNIWFLIFVIWARNYCWNPLPDLSFWQNFKGGIWLYFWAMPHMWDIIRYEWFAGSW